MFVLVILHYGVGYDRQHQNSDQDVDFVLQAQKRAVGEGDDETEGLPHPVVGERCLLVPREKDAVKSCKIDEE